MATLDEVYRKFGETFEVAQLLETEIGTLLVTHNAIEAGLLERPNPIHSRKIYDKIESKTLGKLIKELTTTSEAEMDLKDLLRKAWKSRNRLAHAFFQYHNFRRNSVEGRDEMLRDLEEIHINLFEAYKAILLLSGTNLEKIDSNLLEEYMAILLLFGTNLEQLSPESTIPLPTEHLPIRTKGYRT